MIDGQMLIPLRFRMEPSDDNDVSAFGVPSGLRADTYMIEIEVLDLRAMLPRTIRVDAPMVRMLEQQLPSISDLKSDQLAYLRHLRDQIDEVLG